MNTHVTPSIDAPFEFPNFDLESLRGEITDWHTNKMAGLMKEHEFGPDQVHVLEGLAEERIPQVAKDLSAQLVVMGTVGRKGLSAAFMGNTAERVLSHLECEVLALKPGSEK